MTFARTALTIGQLVTGALVVSRLLPGAVREPALAPAEENHSFDMTVVIPARNEATRIGACLQGLASQSPHTIVVDDESSDGTAAIAVGHGAKVVTGAPVPEGWVGKPWALQQGLEAATTEWVLFLDADVRPRPGLVGAVVQRANASGAHVTSVGARFTTASPWQQGLHAAFLAGLVYRFGPTGSRVTPAADRTLLNGQCMLVRRTWLLSQGGFEGSAGHLTDDIALAQHLARRGARISFLDGADVLDVEMYATTAETWEQWGRSLPMNDVLSRRARVVDLITLWLTQVVPVVRLVTGRVTVVDIALLGIRSALNLAFARTFARPGVGLFASILADPAAVFRLTQATLRPVTKWRGREYGSAGTAAR